MALYGAVQAGQGRQSLPEARAAAGCTLLMRNPNMTIGLFILGVMGVVAIFAPLIDRYDPLRLAVVDRLTSPNAEHWFGTDSFGRDLYARTVHGARLSLLVGASVVAIAAVAGEVLGLIAGYDRRMDAVLMRIVDAIMAFPGLLLRTGVDRDARVERSERHNRHFGERDTVDRTCGAEFGVEPAGTAVCRGRQGNWSPHLADTAGTHSTQHALGPSRFRQHSCSRWRC